MWVSDLAFANSQGRTHAYNLSDETRDSSRNIGAPVQPIYHDHEILSKEI